MPRPATAHAAGLDLQTFETATLQPGQRRLFRMGYSLDIPEGMCAQLWERSGLALNHGVDILGGIIDCDYTGEVGVILKNGGDRDFTTQPGMAIAQLLVVGVGEYSALALSQLTRGTNGFGSTDTRWEADNRAN